MANMSIISAFKIAVLSLLVLYPSSSFQQGRQIDPEIQRKIEDYIRDVYLPQSGSSEIGLAIVQNDGEVLFTEGYGMSDRERGIPNGNDTEFLIGSVSKSFTSVVLVKLLHETFPDLGEAVLDTPVRLLLPQFNFTLSDRFRSEHATPRDLVSHRLCLFRDDVHTASDPFRTTDELVYRTRYIPEICGVRSNFEYNNQMYVIAGEIIAELAGKPYEEAVEDVLQELGMTNSRFSRRNDDYENGLENRARPYYVHNGTHHPINTDLVKRVTSHNAAGGLFVPPNDMVKYMRFQLNKGNLDGRQIVPQNAMEWIFKPSMLNAETSYKENDDDIVLNYSFAYGLGWFLGSLDGYEYNQHGGHFPSYISHVSFFPSKNLAIYTSTNVEPVLVSPISLHAYIFLTLIGKDNAEAMEKAEKVRREVDLHEMNKGKAGIQEMNKILGEMKESAKRLKQAESILGRFGSGSAGNVEITERFNEETNMTQYFIDYKGSLWYQGWLTPIVDENSFYLYRVDFVTDLIQDTYTMGLDYPIDYIAFGGEDVIVFLQLINIEIGSALAVFERNVGLDTLPEIPWAPDSCGL